MLKLFNTFLKLSKSLKYHMCLMSSYSLLSDKKQPTRSLYLQCYYFQNKIRFKSIVNGQHQSCGFDLFLLGNEIEPFFWGVGIFWIDLNQTDLRCLQLDTCTLRNGKSRAQPAREDCKVKIPARWVPAITPIWI